MRNPPLVLQELLEIQAEEVALQIEASAADGSAANRWFSERLWAPKIDTISLVQDGLYD